MDALDVREARKAQGPAMEEACDTYPSDQRPDRHARCADSASQAEHRSLKGHVAPRGPSPHLAGGLRLRRWCLLPKATGSESGALEITSQLRDSERT